MTTRPTQENLYIQRMNAVISHARQNLDADLSVEKLAQVAGFSPFHFHRLFKSLTGETLNELVVRLRLERAVLLLRSTPALSITDAAFDAGFQSISVFSRAFKRQYGVRASQWDRQSPLKNSKNRQLPRDFPRYTLEQLSDFATDRQFDVKVYSLPAQRLAFIRVFDSYSQFGRIIDAYQRLIAWYCQRGGQLDQTTLYGMSQDDPDVTPHRLCRFDWGLTVPNTWQAGDEVDIVTFPACQVATVHCQGSIEEEDKALQFLFRHWLPQSRYQPANLPGMEIYRRQPIELGWETYDMDCAVPIVAL